MVPPPEQSDRARRREIHREWETELRRKSTHVLALLIPLGIVVLAKGALYVLTLLALLSYLVDVLRVRNAAVAAGIDRRFGTLMRPAERPPLGGRVSLNGVTRALITSTLLLAVFPARIAAAAFAAFMIADAAATLTGIRFGTLHWGSGPRTVEGTVAFLLTGQLVLAALPGIDFWVGALAVASAAIVEAVDEPLHDNLLAPMTAAAVMFGLERFALGREVHLLFGL